MTKFNSFGKFFKNNGFEIGLDVVPVNLEATYKGTEQFEGNSRYTLGDVVKISKDDIYIRHQQNTWVIANRATNESFITTNREIIDCLAQNNYPVNETEDRHLPFILGYQQIEFENKNIQKAWENHLEYMRPENVFKRKEKAAHTKLLAAYRETHDKYLPPIKDVKDVIRAGGFTPNDYVEIKNGMTHLALRDKSEQTIVLPKTEEVAANHYMVTIGGGTYMIGNTNTDKAILTKNTELVKEFDHNNYRNIQHNEILDTYYVPSAYGVEFKDTAIARKWNNHLREVKKQGLTIQKQTFHFAKIYGISKERAEENVLKNRRSERRSKRNIEPNRKYLDALGEELRNKKPQEPMPTHGQTVSEPPKKKSLLTFFFRSVGLGK